MKIILIITVCEAYKNRAINQFNNLIKHKKHLKKHKIVPIFFTSKEPLSFDVSPFLTINFPHLEETYNNLYLKILESLKYVNSELEYDYVIKIDDDTLFNIDRFNSTMLTADYIGSPEINLAENYISLPRLNLFKKIDLGMHKGKCFYMCGDFYALSKKAIEHVLSNIEKVKKIKEEFICEDYLIGYLLENAPITTKNIKLTSTKQWEEQLQITENYISIHPIMDKDFDKLVNVPFKEQIKRLEEISSKISHAYRTMLVEQLQKQLIDVIKTFFNSQKSSGIC
jgi:hypothetical protein